MLRSYVEERFCICLFFSFARLTERTGRIFLENPQYSEKVIFNVKKIFPYLTTIRRQVRGFPRN